MVSAADPMLPCKRPALDQDLRPTTKIRAQEDRASSTSPNSQRHDLAFSYTPSPAVGSVSVKTQSFSAGQRSAQRTPFSSPKLTSPQPVPVPVPVPMTQPNSRQSLPRHDGEKNPFSPAPSLGTSNHDTALDQTSKIELQPETRPVTQDQLVNEIKGIYAGLVMVEKKCVEVCLHQSQSSTKLSNEQWQALIALHRTLLHEHLDFFQATQHPAASPALRRLPTKYAMPARMWRHAIHSFLELLRHLLPQSLEHMLSFVYLAYQMMGLLLEYVPAFHETWIECLGDLARYRMAIEETDMRDRETWANVARMWYNRAADRSPTTGRIQHHLAVLARPNIVRQLFYYSKALTSGIPFVNARDSIMLLYSPFLEKSQSTIQKYPKLESSFVTAGGILFTQGWINQYCVHVTQYISELDNHISRTGSNWKVQGSEIALSLIAWLLDFGTDQNFLWTAFRTHTEEIKGTQHEKQLDPITDTRPPEDPYMKQDIHHKFWNNGSINVTLFRQVLPAAGARPGAKFTSADEVTSYVLPVWSTSISIVAGKVGDRNILPFMHITLAFLWSLSYVPGALVYIENYVPWTKLVLCLNTLSRSGVVDARIEAEDFPQHQSGTGRQLPEDFLMRGLEWAYYYFPADFFEGQVVDEDERTLELPSHAAPRAERCLWLGGRLAQLNRYMIYDTISKQFSCTEFATSLENPSLMDCVCPQTSVDSDVDAQMIDIV
ncbi:hypothetical protein A1O3_08169 [Capronia epimyces CBS 606.96]|uniref:DNA/RNA-binding domain-containing protein n=1 Tax=Capronia epimyces CBS 606.96 TaxID=1182542 RepID=W9YC35_9EURO|nr:uncharacterized protein A1O3_08169 [Capronia epimyces CBS 606.96]EXJ79884.1 hypothetical protein A1O3_08169 [Capronia epimyces CBS 606.96]